MSEEAAEKCCKKCEACGKYAASGETCCKENKEKIEENEEEFFDPIDPEKQLMDGLGFMDGYPFRTPRTSRTSLTSIFNVLKDPFAFRERLQFMVKTAEELLVVFDRAKKIEFTSAPADIDPCKSTSRRDSERQCRKKGKKCCCSSSSSDRNCSTRTSSPKCPRAVSAPPVLKLIAPEKSSLRRPSAAQNQEDNGVSDCYTRICGQFLTDSQKYMLREEPLAPPETSPCPNTVVSNSEQENATVTQDPTTETPRGSLSKTSAQSNRERSNSSVSSANKLETIPKIMPISEDFEFLNDEPEKPLTTSDDLCDSAEPEREEIEDESAPEPESEIRLPHPQQRDLKLCRGCSCQACPVFDRNGNIVCASNCGCCMCPWKKKMAQRHVDNGASQIDLNRNNKNINSSEESTEKFYTDELCSEDHEPEKPKICKKPFVPCCCCVGQKSELPITDDLDAISEGGLNSPNLRLISIKVEDKEVAQWEQDIASYSRSRLYQSSRLIELNKDSEWDKTTDALSSEVVSEKLLDSRITKASEKSHKGHIMHRRKTNSYELIEYVDAATDPVDFNSAGQSKKSIEFVEECELSCEEYGSTCSTECDSECECSFDEDCEECVDSDECEADETLSCEEESCTAQGEEIMLDKKSYQGPSQQCSQGFSIPCEITIHSMSSDKTPVQVRTPCRVSIQPGENNVPSKPRNLCASEDSERVKNNEKLQSFMEELFNDLLRMKNCLARQLYPDCCPPPCPNPSVVCPPCCKPPPCHPCPPQPPKFNTSYPVSIKSVKPLGNCSLYVCWAIHDYEGIGGYELAVDGCVTNRFYSAGHDSAIVRPIDIFRPHQLVLVAFREFRKCPLPKENVVARVQPNCPSPAAAPKCPWSPSCFLYDPMCPI